MYVFVKGIGTLIYFYFFDVSFSSIIYLTTCPFLPFYSSTCFGETGRRLLVCRDLASLVGRMELVES